MTGTDLIVVAPWIAFGVVLAVVCILLLRSNCASRRDCPQPQEARCSQKNAKARQK
jgi:hypothetical protein